MFDSLNKIGDMGTLPFTLTEEQEREFKAAVDNLYSISQKHDIPLLVMATLRNIDTGESMAMRSVVMTNIDIRKATPVMASIAAALEGSREDEDTPFYIRLLMSSVVLALKEKGLGASFELVAALIPILKPYVERAARNLNEDDMSADALDSFKDLLERLSLDDVEDDGEDD